MMWAQVLWLQLRYIPSIGIHTATVTKLQDAKWLVVIPFGQKSPS